MRSVQEWLRIEPRRRRSAADFLARQGRNQNADCGIKTICNAKNSKETRRTAKKFLSEKQEIDGYSNTKGKGDEEKLERNVEIFDGRFFGLHLVILLVQS